MNITKEKEALIEMFGVHFESLYHLPPLSSRILGVLILDCCRRGLTFEALVERMNASKSSVSTNLNLLLKSNMIAYYTLPGDRKKYYKPAPFSERLTNYLKIVDYEKQVLNRLLAYREQTVSCDEERRNMENIIAYKEHVQEIEDLFGKTIKKFKEIEQLSK